MPLCQINGNTFKCRPSCLRLSIFMIICRYDNLFDDDLFFRLKSHEAKNAKTENLPEKLQGNEFGKSYLQ